MEKSLKPGKSLKAHMIKEYADRFEGSLSLFVTDFGRLTNKELEELRKRLRRVSANYIIVKNSICRLAFEKLKLKGVADMVTESCALSYGKGDPISISKVLVDFANSNKSLKLKGGYMEGEVITTATIVSLATLPSREVLLAKLVNCLNSPIAGFVSACSGIIRKFVYALNEVSKKKPTGNSG